MKVELIADNIWVETNELIQETIFYLLSIEQKVQKT